MVPFKKFTASRPFDPRSLRAFPKFLHFRMADQGREVLGIGVEAVMEEYRPKAAIARWRDFLEQEPGHSMGHVAYGLKDGLEPLVSRHQDVFHRPIVRWFAPLVHAAKEHDQWTVNCAAGADELAAEVVQALIGDMEPDLSNITSSTPWRCTTEREAYLRHANALMEHLRRGDIYEVNYCVQRVAQLPGWDPFTAAAMLLKNVDAPFASFYRWDEQFALAASPERFLRFGHGRVWSQPMKGTRPRHVDPAMDKAEAEQLASDPKERSENIMATDVVRNDLSRVGDRESVRLEELCAVKSHRQVHQMVSTVSATLRPGCRPVEAVQAAFPMASMTGAPKVRAMALIDEHEDQNRGLFSGSLGWFGPEGTGDLNVVIRTIEHDAGSGFTRLLSGSALTAACDPESEWEECALKARSVLQAIGHAGA
ncbi:MAG: anthranilate synthase component I family protein [Flavobacteriales bacterium]|nr:anthranilate synthase component I family protein [Flavobacteriales bacterium]MBK6753915.1 anthranilate synthase component I family protein [Flavobacteriales bacterium]MBK7083402.1 anthranilate synthase component I family protein [Flavobacteriales bacterium]MBK7270783.1 anthranilate synthase component I family protein [Flavobacteriales bacterium]MBK9076459.1 anthranilate synthase component I family protein [Flavobacteriales bacterium]